MEEQDHLPTVFKGLDGHTTPPSPGLATHHPTRTRSPSLISFCRREQLRPLIMVYCHRASSRIIPGPMDEVFGLAHAQQVPLIVALTDVCSIDDSDLRKVRDELCVLAGDCARVVEINSEQKTVRGHQHKVFPPTLVPALRRGCLGRVGERCTPVVSRQKKG